MSPIRPFHFPIPPDAVRLFASGDQDAVFGMVVSHDGEVLACNGEVALRVTRGHFQDVDFPPATPEFLERFEAIPWLPWPAADGGHWRALDDERGRIAAARPGWVLTGPCHVCRLESIRLLARLPRCDVWPATCEGEALPFRFNGGRGLVGFSRAKPLKIPLAILQTSRNFDGTLKQRGAKIDLGLPGWPPPEPSE